MKTSLTSTNEEGNERQPLLSKNNEQEKEKDEEEGKKSSSGRFPKTCKTIGAFSALTMTAAVCFVGYQVYPVVSDDLSLGNIAQHLKSYLLVDLPNGNLKPVLPDESDLLPIDSDGTSSYRVERTKQHRRPRFLRFPRRILKILRHLANLLLLSLRKMPKQTKIQTRIF